MPSTAERRTALAGIIATLFEAGERLQRILEDERQALRRQDSAALSAVAEVKHRTVDELEGLEKARRRLCAACGSAPDPARMPALLAECGADESSTRGWHQVLSLVARCQEQNAINGAVIRLRRRQCAAALRIVRGSSSETFETYGPTGCDVTPQDSRPLAEI